MVPENFHPADDIIVFVYEQGGGHGYGNFFLLAVDDICGGGDIGSAFFHGLFQGAVHLAHIGPEHLPAVAADGIFSADTGDFFGSPVERGDLPVVVNGEYPVGNAFQDNLGGFLGQRAEYFFWMIHALLPAGYMGWFFIHKIFRKCNCGSRVAR